MAVRVRELERRELPKEKIFEIHKLRPVQLETQRRKVVSQIQRQIQAVTKGIEVGRVNRPQGLRILEMLNHRLNRISSPLSKEQYASKQVYDKLITDENARRNFVIAEQGRRAKELEAKTFKFWERKKRQERAAKLRELERSAIEKRAELSRYDEKKRSRDPWITSILSEYFHGEIESRTNLSPREREKFYFWLNNIGNNYPKNSRLLKGRYSNVLYAISQITRYCEGMPIETMKKMVAKSFEAIERGSNLSFYDGATDPEFHRTSRILSAIRDPEKRLECFESLLTAEEMYKRKYGAQISDTYLFSKLAEIVAWGSKNNVPERALFNYVTAILNVAVRTGPKELDKFASEMDEEDLMR
ncbi:MAG: hypothetical protein PHH82_02245 [Candidatus ainarchaeum sp.]|nr:hypothetical protein [Candidatus ainarchaeum sp.]